MKIMKKVLAFTLVIAMVFALVSCGGKKLSGTYTAGGDLLGLAGGKTSYTFSGNKVTIAVTASLFGASKTTEYEGTYAITEASDGSMTISMTFEDSDASDYTVSNIAFKEDKNAGTITIGLITYTKQ